MKEQTQSWSGGESHLIQVLHMMLGGSKDHRLLLRLCHIPQEVQQQRRLVVHTQVEERQLMDDMIRKHLRRAGHSFH